MEREPFFVDRAAAGRALAPRLAHLVRSGPVVAGLPRGGVAVALPVARALGAPLDVIVVRKLGVPWQPELAMGALGEGGARYVDLAVMRAAGVTSDELDGVVAGELRELDRRLSRYRSSCSPVPLAGRTVVVVDDGIATGSTAVAAVQVARAQGAARIVVAAPVAAATAVAALGRVADEVVTSHIVRSFGGIGQFYGDFTPVTDDEVVAMLEAGRCLPVATGPEGDTGPVDTDVVVDTVDARLEGHLHVPAGARGIVVFAHGSGSSRFSPRNRSVADSLGRAGLGTLLVDLLTPDEAASRARVFDIELLTDRLLGVTAWLRSRPVACRRDIAYFGASTGAAAALRAAAVPGNTVAAVVARGGRPDLAGDRIAAARVPTLFVVGGADPDVLALNRMAMARMTGERRLAVVPGAGHLFEEPGALDQVADLAAAWFVDHLHATHQAA
ncbi:MAG: phosphoribosyltransferase family protein [Actinomycetota bacterium]|nr:phosphoribosyltransferase family protein [Actinomycetota bacterium]